MKGGSSQRGSTEINESPARYLGILITCLIILIRHSFGCQSTVSVFSVIELDSLGHTSIYGHCIFTVFRFADPFQMNAGSFFSELRSAFIDVNKASKWI